MSKRILMLPTIQQFVDYTKNCKTYMYILFTFRENFGFEIMLIELESDENIAIL